MNTSKIAVALNLDYSSIWLIMDKVGHEMCLKAQCAFRVAPNSCHYGDVWSTVDKSVRNIEILVKIHRHRSKNTGCPQRIDKCSSMISFALSLHQCWREVPCWDMLITCGWNVIHDGCNAVNASCMWADSQARSCTTKSCQESQPCMRIKVVGHGSGCYICRCNADTEWLATGCPHLLQLVGVANPSTKEPIRVASTTSAVLLQSSAQNKRSQVGRDDGVGKI